MLSNCTNLRKPGPGLAGEGWGHGRTANGRGTTSMWRPTSQTLDRARSWESSARPVIGFNHGTWTEVEVRPLGDKAAVIRDRLAGEGTYRGNSFKDDHRVVRVCARVEGQWAGVMEQSAPRTSPR